MTTQPDTAPLRERRGCWSRSRTTLSVVVLLFGLSMFLWALVFSWANYTISDREEFATRTVQLLDSEAVRTQLANQLADEIVESGPSTLVSYRSVLVIVIQSVVQTDAFKSIFRNAVMSAHDAAFSDSSDSIVLNLVDSLSVIEGTLAVTAPDVAKQIPVGITELAVQVTEQVRALQLGQVARDLDDLTGQMVLVALVAFGASVAIATHRRHAVMRIGFGWVGVAALVLVALQLGKFFGTRGIADPGLQSAVRSTINVVTADLWTQMLWLGVLGVLIAAVANASAPGKRRFDQQQVAEWVRRRVLAPPKSAAGRVFRGLALILVGVLLLTSPAFFLQVAVALAGAWLAYIGFTEVILIIGRHRGAEVPTPAGSSLPPPDAATGVAGTTGHSHRWRIAALVTLLVLLIGVGAVVTTRAARTSASAAGELKCNGFVELCDRPLDQVVFATSHNSMSAAREPGWLFGEHLGGIRAQLEYGIRGFLIDTHYGVPSGLTVPGVTSPVVVTDAGDEIGRAQLTEPSSTQVAAQADQLSREVPVGASGATPDVYLCHNYCELGATRFTDALAQYQQFLTQNPNEVIILFLEDYVSTTDSERAFREAGLLDRIWTPTAGEPMPTLRSLIDARTNVVVLSEHMGGTPAWYQAGFQVSEETPYTFTDIDQFSCAANRGGTGKPLFLINHWLTSGAPDMAQTTKANSYDVLMGRVQRCQEERGRKVNMIGVNFYDRGDLLRVVDELNGVGG